MQPAEEYAQQLFAAALDALGTPVSSLLPTQWLLLPFEAAQEDMLPVPEEAAPTERPRPPRAAAAPTTAWAMHAARNLAKAASEGPALGSSSSPPPAELLDAAVAAAAAAEVAGAESWELALGCTDLGLIETMPPLGLSNIADPLDDLDAILAGEGASPGQHPARSTTPTADVVLEAAIVPGGLGERATVVHLSGSEDGPPKECSAGGLSPRRGLLPAPDVAWSPRLPANICNGAQTRISPARPKERQPHDWGTASVPQPVSASAVSMVCPQELHEMQQPSSELLQQQQQVVSAHAVCATDDAVHSAIASCSPDDDEAAAIVDVVRIPGFSAVDGSRAARLRSGVVLEGSVLVRRMRKETNKELLSIGARDASPSYIGQVCICRSHVGV